MQTVSEDIARQCKCDWMTGEDCVVIQIAMAMDPELVDRWWEIRWRDIPYEIQAALLATLTSHPWAHWFRSLGPARRIKEDTVLPWLVNNLALSERTEVLPQTPTSLLLTSTHYPWLYHHVTEMWIQHAPNTWSTTLPPNVHTVHFDVNIHHRKNPNMTFPHVKEVFFSCMFNHPGFVFPHARVLTTEEKAEVYVLGHQFPQLELLWVDDTASFGTPSFHPWKDTLTSLNVWWDAHSETDFPHFPNLTDVSLQGGYLNHSDDMDSWNELLTLQAPVLISLSIYQWDSALFQQPFPELKILCIDEIDPEWFPNLPHLEVLGLCRLSWEEYTFEPTSWPPTLKQVFVEAPEKQLDHICCWFPSTVRVIHTKNVYAEPCFFR